MTNKALIPLLAVGLVACGRGIDGPAPSADGTPPLAPSAVCHYQAPVKVVTIRGDGLSPLPTKVMEDAPLLVLPKLELLRTQDIASAATSDAAVAIADDPAAAVQSKVRWINATEMRFTLDATTTLSTGLFAVRATNANGATTTWKDANALLVVPPPAVSKVSPNLLCASKTNRFTLTGDFLLRQGTTVPTVTATPAGGKAIPLKVNALGDCRKLPGTSGIEACKTITVDLPANTLAPGTTHAAYDIVVRNNPAPVGCDSTRDQQGKTTAKVVLTVVPEPKLTTIAPTQICEDKATTLTLTGTGFLTVGSTTPTVTVGSKRYTPTAKGCTAIPGTNARSCTSLEITIPKRDLAPGSYKVSVTNPAPADCSATTSLTIEIVPLPTITAVVPASICAGGGVLTITGTGFHKDATVTVNNVKASAVTFKSATEISATFGAGLGVGGPYDLTLTNPGGCAVTKKGAVRVKPGPQLFFADPPVVYNGITTVVTIYGTGFAGNPSSVAIRPTGSTAKPTVLTHTYATAKANRVQAAIPKGTATGDYDILLTDSTACPAVLVKGLKIVDKVTLKLTSIDPPFGHTASTTAVTVFADKATGGGLKAVPRLYLNPTAGTRAAPIGSVAFVDAGRATALVPKGLAVDAYDLIAVNPDGGVGLLPKAFSVTALAPPTISELTPGSIPNKSGQAVKATGQNFRKPAAALRCIDPTTGAATTSAPRVVVNTFTATQVNLVVDASTMGNGAVCVLRITNDDKTYGDISALVITNPSANLSAFRAGQAMATARRALAATGNRATTAARFIYAIGGDSGSTSGALSSVEVGSVDIFGRPGAFFTQTYGLTGKRTFATAASVGRCIYVVGGNSGSAALATVERGCVLDPANRPEVTDLDLDVVASGGLAAGLWYYQVAAVMPAGHVTNPGGETLPSDPFPLLLPKLTAKVLKVTVHWARVSGAAGYRVYRSPASGAAANALRLVATIGSGATTSFSDTGIKTQTGAPLRTGATGKWHVLGARLGTARQGPGVTSAPDPGDTTGMRHHLYVVGGKDASNALTTYERLPVTLTASGSQTVGTFSVGTAKLDTGSWQLAALSVGNPEASFVPAGKRFIYAVGGVASNGRTGVDDVRAFEVQAGGALKAPTTVSALKPFRAGAGAAAAVNHLFVFGAKQGRADTTATAAKLCDVGTSKCKSGPPDLVNWNAAGTSLLTGRYLMGSAIQSGFIYILGGSTAGASATKTTEYVIW